MDKSENSYFNMGLGTFICVLALISSIITRNPDYDVFVWLAAVIPNIFMGAFICIHLFNIMRKHAHYNTLVRAALYATLGLPGVFLILLAILTRINEEPGSDIAVIPLLIVFTVFTLIDWLQLYSIRRHFVFADKVAEEDIRIEDMLVLNNRLEVVYKTTDDDASPGAKVASNHHR